MLSSSTQFFPEILDLACENERLKPSREAALKHAKRKNDPPTHLLKQGAKKSRLKAAKQASGFINES